MKKEILSALLTLLCVFAALAQPGRPPVGDAGMLLSGEHTPVIYTGSGTASGSSSYTTEWLQIGYSPSASATANNNIGRFNPEQFTLGLTIALGSGADSALISSAHFEVAYDTTSEAFWNGDSSNLFIAPDNYVRADYGIWTFRPVSGETPEYLFPLRVLQGGYIRMVFETTTADEVEIEWTLTGEN